MQNDATHLHITEVPTQRSTGAGNGETLNTNGIGTYYYDPASSRTGVILQAGVEEGQQITVVNTASGASSVTFAAAATSNVAAGASCVIAQNKAIRFVWDPTTARWYETD